MEEPLTTSRRSFWPLRLSPLARLCAAVCLAGSLAVGIVDQRTEAAVSGCRSDPVLVVNGVTVDVVATLATVSSSVRELDYAVTVPVGSLINQTTLTVGIGFPEKVNYTFSSAQPWGTMRIAMTVVTASGVQPFQTTEQATTLLSGLTLLAGGTASGLSNSVLVVNLGGLPML